ncbi:cytochrome oxidase assembly protein [metagenome]|uniref:Cytochrome oxidase assembly protein n=1 Tax=metagenome TaxID=256318 RepID=A0A2P2C941_9ZZZZ
MGVSSVSPSPWLQRLAWANLVANIGIVLTGGAVRLTGSGLGCPTWPSCTEESLVPHQALGINGAIEFGNRMLTFVLTAVAVACFVVALRSGERLATRLSAGIALGIPAQAVIGGITVLTDLNPWIVAFHLLVSMAMIGLCVWLVATVRGGPVDRTPAATRRLAWLIFAVGWVVLYLGTVVTGSGPHSGDAQSRRTGLDAQVMSHLHASAVYVLVALTIGLVAVTVRTGQSRLRRAAVALLLVEVGQGFVGFLQYYLGVPSGLVAVHLLGAALTSAALTWVVLGAGNVQRVSSGSSATATKSRLR